MGCHKFKEGDAVIIVCTRETRKKRRLAHDELEAWAARTLLFLAKGEAFEEKDRDFGSSLAFEAEKKGKLTEKQWEYAVKLAKSYANVNNVPPIKGQLKLL